LVEVHPEGDDLLVGHGNFGEVESSFAEGRESFNGMRLEASRGVVYIGRFNLHQGSRSNPNGLSRRRMIKSIGNIQNL
jgi:hypothetical protein